MVKVVEYYRDWVPPTGVRRTIDRLLEATPQQYLIGLRSVVLTNAASLTGKRRRGTTVSRKRKVALNRCGGLYHRSRHDQQASIEIFVDNCLEPLPTRLRNVSLFLDLGLGPVWFHELGHHIHSTVAREYGERENVADRWSRRLFRPYFRRNYWWLTALFFPLRPLFRLWLRSRRRSQTALPGRNRRAA
ncbi:MAG TPA: hypothetical protein VGR43_02020 [Dehalococcoidia bacterium]|jgi:hypothetical protein|nr:hypothetical protein [Dehalococcoidia bacterium]